MATSSDRATYGPLEQSLHNEISGDVRFDSLSRTLYSTDASIYEIVPTGVVFPKNVADIVAAVNICRRVEASIVARGAGTGLTGGAVGPGVQLDLSRYMNHIGELDVDRRTVVVEPGVVLDQLNTFLAPHGLRFAPDVATASRATIGGMIANNSCGAHSVVYGRTVDHVLSLTVVLSDGSVVTFDRDTPQSESRPKRTTEICDGLAQIRDHHIDEISRRFPKIMRSNGGYGLDRLGQPGTPIDATKVLCGSEGTLGVIAGAKLNLVPLPPATGLAVLHFDSVHTALAATPAILKHAPAAVELVDHLITQAGRSSKTFAQTCGFLHGDPKAILIVEFFADTPGDVAEKVAALARDEAATGGAQSTTIVPDPTEQANVWNLRTAGLGLLMSKPGDRQAYSFIEDTAVHPNRLGDYIERLAAIVEQENIHAGYYAHASVGCIHVKPILNLKTADGVEQMKRVAGAVCNLAVEFGGTMTGEHGDGIVRSGFLERMYGPKIIEAFHMVKHLFDPCGLMNPGKIVNPLAMTEHLRLGASYKTQQLKTYFDFSRHGGMAGLAEMCSGVGQCRQKNVATMCPSYVATCDEMHSTRGRANALRTALSNRGLLNGLDDPAIVEVMDLCISCKACKTECPTGVDMARMKPELLARGVLREGASPRARWIADLPAKLKKASKAPRVANAIARSAAHRAWLERRVGLDRRIVPPMIATTTFRQWFRTHRSGEVPGEAPKRSVVYFVDTWTNFFTPQVGIATVEILETLGYDVICPGTVCCGRAAISQGLLAEARELAEFNVRRLAYLARRGIPIVGTEPSCILTLLDEYPDLVLLDAAKQVAKHVQTIETFLRRALADQPELAWKNPRDISLRYHGHCHQKALVGTGDAAALLKTVFGDNADVIDSGCCGMAGSFGHEVEHYDMARAIGEDRLFPAIRNRGESQIAVSGFSCRQQIEHHTGVKPRHIVEFVADALRKGSAQACQPPVVTPHNL